MDSTKLKIALFYEDFSYFFHFRAQNTYVLKKLEEFDKIEKETDRYTSLLSGKTI